jgi:hypothetical protein
MHTTCYVSDTNLCRVKPHLDRGFPLIQTRRGFLLGFKRPIIYSIYISNTILLWQIDTTDSHRARPPPRTWAKVHRTETSVLHRRCLKPGRHAELILPQYRLHPEHPTNFFAGRQATLPPLLLGALEVIGAASVLQSNINRYIIM